MIKHVLYIIKENRTYDQVFGDIEKGEGDPSLCICGEEVTPNHHKLVNEFVLLDNFYWSGILSADGHQWTDEVYVTSYLEKAFGGFPRSFPYDGGDALAVTMVVSPYTKRKSVDSTNYNQTSMVRTIEMMLGLPPMNQLDASATPMTECFNDAPDLTPYDVAPNIIPLDRINPALADIKDHRELHWAKVSLESPLEEVDEDTLNRILWFAARRRDDTYPAWAVLDLDEDEEHDDDNDK